MMVSIALAYLSFVAQLFSELVSKLFAHFRKFFYYSDIVIQCI